MIGQLLIHSCITDEAQRTNTLQGQETFKLLILSYKEYAY